MTKTSEAAPAAPQKVSIAIILDRSGSMESSREDAIGAVNSYLRQLREDGEIDGSVSLVTFDTQSIDTIRDRVPARTCPELALAEFQPRGGTPLYDAVGHGIGLLERNAAQGDRRILAIMTDGLENSSREFTLASLRALMERKQRDEGWLVLYLGADHDTWAQADQLGLARGNVASFSKGRMMMMADTLHARAKRYTRAADPRAEAVGGGFTAEERAAISEDDRNT